MMSNQVLEPPTADTARQNEQNAPPLWSHIQEAEGSFWQSLAENLRDHFAPQEQPELRLESKPVPVADPLARPRDQRSSWISIVVHVVVLAAILATLFLRPKKKVMVVQAPPPPQVFNITPFMPFQASAAASGGGGGGGDHSITPAVQGKLPKIDKTQFVPPDEVIRNPKPKLAVEPTVVMPDNLKLPNNNMPNLGDPLTKVSGPTSNGTGSNGGIGSGKSGGVGSGTGAGVGPGEGGGYGGGVYNVGGGVLPPKVIYAVDAEFSDQARMAKYQGVVVVGLVVDAAGMPRNIHVVRPLGMGLDEKAVEAVKQYRFKPATLKGHPVPVNLDLQVDFHIY